MAVRIFQQIHSIPDTGVVNQQTWTKLVTVWQSRTQGGINSSFTPTGGATPTPDPTPAPRPAPTPTPTPSPIDRDINTWYNNDMHILIQLARYYGAEIDGPAKSIIVPNAIFGCSIGITIQLIYENAAAIQFTNGGINVTAGSMDFFVGLTFGFTGLSHGIFYGYSTANVSYKFAYGGNWYQQTVDYILSYRTDYGVTALIKVNLTINRFTKAFVVVLAGGLIYVGVPALSLAPGLTLLPQPAGG
jgi:hypothetical protein